MQKISSWHTVPQQLCQSSWIRGHLGKNRDVPIGVAEHQGLFQDKDWTMQKLNSEEEKQQSWETRLEII